MILFRTKFPVFEDFTQDVFLEFLKDYIMQSPLYALRPVFGNDERFEYACEVDSQKLSVYRTKEYVAAQLTYIHENKIFTDTYILSKSNGVSVVFVCLEQNVSVASDSVAFDFEIPQFVRDIFWHEYAGCDSVFHVDDKPHMLCKSDMSVVEQIGSHIQSFLLPVVCVSPFECTGQYALDAYDLARRLLGVAHVAVVSNPYISHCIQEHFQQEHFCDMFIPDGHVCLFLPNGDTKVFPLDVNVSEIVRYVTQISANVEVEDSLSFSKLCLSYVMENMQDDDELAAAYEYILSDNETMISSLKSELDDSRKCIADLRSKVEALRSQLDRVKVSETDVQTGVNFFVSEHSLYDGELSDVILKVLQKEFDRMTGDKNLMNSRKYHVLFDVLQNNVLTGIADDIIHVFSKNVQDGTLSREGRRMLESYGFEISKPNGHYKIAYGKDGRYQMAISSSPSDNRAGDNLSATYMNMLFGY